MSVFSVRIFSSFRFFRPKIQYVGWFVSGRKERIVLNLLASSNNNELYAIVSYVAKKNNKLVSRLFSQFYIRFSKATNGKSAKKQWNHSFFRCILIKFEWFLAKNQFTLYKKHSKLRKTKFTLKNNVLMPILIGIKCKCEFSKFNQTF